MWYILHTVKIVTNVGTKNLSSKINLISSIQVVKDASSNAISFFQNFDDLTAHPNRL